jgi:transcriptional regulator with XRE-family HTH domain
MQAELARRCAENPRYSLRAFAQRLGIDHSTLSQILRGKRRVTTRTIERVGRSLRITADRIAGFVAFEQEHPPVALTVPTRDQAVRLARDLVELLTQWVHFAILELTSLEAFRPDSRWIAQVLGVTADEVNIAIARLVRYRLLDMTTPTRWEDRSRMQGTAVEDFVRYAVTQLSHEARDLARRSITTQPE